MYCIKCGVELADTEKTCPLCGTTVYHPDITQAHATPTYPPFVKEKENMRPQGVLFILTVLALMPIVITLFCDLRLNGAITWSGYAVGGILVAYFVIVLPLWFARPNPVIFVPIDFALIGALLLYINLMTGGDWFLSLAFPALGIMGLIITALVTLMRYVRKGLLYIFGGCFIAIGGYCLLLEFFINLTFYDSFSFIWSPYPFIFCFFAGLALIVIAISRPLRESLHRKLFI
ncbi:MAG: zinc ribbon domain-containing protein [Clostridia bacterium]|nr:zinc ribbon domain-containing protein [Clostridia bacterium]